MGGREGSQGGLEKGRLIWYVRRRESLSFYPKFLGRGQYFSHREEKRTSEAIKRKEKGLTRFLKRHLNSFLPDRERNLK